jgi:hypothetical protein
MTGKKYRITCDLFTIPYTKDQSILYAPKVGFLCEANSDVIDLLSELELIDFDRLNEKQNKVLGFLEESGVLNRLNLYPPGSPCSRRTGAI